MPDAQDLVTSATAVQLFAASGAGITLSSAQTTALPLLITAASKLIVREAARYFTLTTYDEVLTPFPGQPDKGESDLLCPSYLPMQHVSRVSADWTTALNVWNTSNAQQATVQYTFTGDVEITTTITGLTLVVSSNGTDTTQTITWGAPPYTVQTLVNAINALGNGWVAATATSMGGWAASALWGDLSPRSGLTPPGASLGLFATPVLSRSDKPAGLVYLTRGAYNGTGPGPWWLWPSSPDLDSGAGGWNGSVRVTYTAGWSTVPEPIQFACFEMVKYMLERTATDGSLKSEKAREYEYEARAAWDAMPDWVRQAVHKYQVTH